LVINYFINIKIFPTQINPFSNISAGKLGEKRFTQ